MLGGALERLELVVGSFASEVIVLGRGSRRRSTAEIAVQARRDERAM
jgi:hypothetical protein